jgi:putative SOS response-associated peptidase YedK
MCGRTALVRSPADLRALVGARRVVASARPFRPSYNIGPGRYTPVIVRDSEGAVDAGAEDAERKDEPAAPADASAAEARGVSSDASAKDAHDSTAAKETTTAATCVTTMRWGLLPSYTKDDEVNKVAYNLINARSETVGTLSVFRRLVRRNRCVVVVDGFYEWHKQVRAGHEVKTPYFVRLSEQGDKPMLLAGLFDRWRPHDTSVETAESVDSYTILTCEPSQAIGWLHDRMPVILDEEGARKWLDCENVSFESCLPLLKPWAGKLVWHAVSDKVNNMRNDGADIWLPVEQAKEKQFQSGLGRFFTRQPQSPAKAASSASSSAAAATDAAPPPAPSDGDKSHTLKREHPDSAGEAPESPPKRARSEPSA